MRQLWGKTCGKLYIKIKFLSSNRKKWPVVLLFIRRMFWTIYEVLIRSCKTHLCTLPWIFHVKQALKTSSGNFPDMFNELVWEKYFMVSRSHQAFYFLGKFLYHDGVPGSRGNFPDMFNEHVWEKYFMVSSSHQAYYFPQTCSLNLSGKIFDTMGVPRGGYISQTCSSKTPKKILPRFFF